MPSREIKNRYRELIDAFGQSGEPTAELLDKLEIQPRQVDVMLRSAGARKMLHRQRMVMGYRAQLLSTRFVPSAVAKMLELISAEKPEISLKACMCVLQLARVTGGGKSRRQKVEKAPAAPAITDPAEMERTLRELGMLMGKREAVDVRVRGET